MDFYIFRHGETFFTKHKIPYYQEQIVTAEILSEGIPVIKKIAEKLKEIPTDANFTSPYKRCLQTTEIISKISGKKFTIDKRLHDFNTYIGESITKVVERISSFYEDLKRNNYKSVAVCTHGYPTSILKCLIIEGAFRLEKLNSYPKPGVLTIIKNGKIKSINFN